MTHAHFLPITAILLLLQVSACTDSSQQSSYTTTRLASAGNNAANLLHVDLQRHTQKIDYKAFTVYYSNDLRIPLCVAYELTNTVVAMADAPDAEQRDNYKFNRDKTIKGCPDWWEYKNSGYDRGHMAPAMDMRWNSKTMAQCFLMTNICPQDHELNGKRWRQIEEAIHYWGGKIDRLIVFTGPVIDRTDRHIGPDNNITVPDAFFKVVYNPTAQRAIAFLLDNRPADKSWKHYVVSIDSVERRAGINLLPGLPDGVETAIERHSRLKDWPFYNPNKR